MKRSTVVAASAAAALLIAAPIADAAGKPADAQYRGTVKNGGKFVVDVDNGKVTTVQAYFPITCQQQSENVGGEILIDGVNLGLKKAGGAYTFKATETDTPKAVIKGTWNKAGTKVTGTIVVAPASLQQECSEAGGPGQNGPITFTATRQSS